MLLILPAAAFLLFFLILHKKETDWRRAALAAAVFWGACVVLITEALSMPRLLSRVPVAICWLPVCIGSFLYLRVLQRQGPGRMGSPRADSEPLSKATKGLLFAAAGVLSLVGITALAAPPNVWDAMDYHLPRVMMWMSNRTVRFFPTPDYNQVIFGPWSEYAMMQTYLLSGSDRFVNLIEFFSLVGSLIAVSLIAKMLGAGQRGQTFAVVFCATIPEGVLEASGPMNTFVVSFWITATVAFLMSFNKNPSRLNTVCVGLAAGLALYTKGLAYIVLPFLVIACWFMGSTADRIRFLKRCGIFLLLIVTLNAPQYLRCYALTGSPLGIPVPGKSPRYELTTHYVTAPGILANTLRNIMLHLPTPSRTVNVQIERFIRLLIRSLGENPDNPQAIFLDWPFKIGHFSSYEMDAGNPLHLFLLMFSAAIAFVHIRRGARGREIFLYAFGLVVSYLFFSALLLWTIWSSRYQLPFFVVGSALAGVVLEQIRFRRAAYLAAVTLLVSATFFAAVNRTRSLIRWSRVDDVYNPRPFVYFFDEHKEVAAANIAAAGALTRSDCREVAVDSYVESSVIGHGPRSFYVYPFLALIHADGRTRRVRYTGVHNLTSRYASEEDQVAPCAVVCFDCVNVPQKWDEYRKVGGRASLFDYIVIFSSAGTVPNPEPPGRAGKQIQ